MYKMKTLKARESSIKRWRRKEQKERLFRHPCKVGLEEAWNIDTTLARWIVPRLKLFLRETDKVGGTPCKLAKEYDVEQESDEAYNKWVEIVNKMLFSFEYYADLYSRRLTTNDEEKARVEEGLYLFAKYYGDLWV